MKAMSACATTNTSLRRRPIAISRSSGMLWPAAQAAPIKEPTLEPIMCDGARPRSMSACRTPTCATPFIPPPPRISVNGVPGLTRCVRLP